MIDRVHLVQCSSNRCDSCSQRFESGCRNLITKNQDPSKSIVLVERQRGLMHVRYPEEPILEDAPWNIDGWETIYIGRDNKIFENLGDLIDIYRVGPYVSLFFHETGTKHIKYSHIPIVGTALELSLLSDLASEYKQSSVSAVGFRECITDYLEKVATEISGQIKERIPEINEKTRARLSQIVAFRTNILGRIFPVLLDEMTEEVYLDCPGTSIYFDHQKLGRCTTSVTYERTEIPRVVTFLRSESNLHLDRSNPSLKMELVLFGSVLRLSASVPPLSNDGLSLEIRRARKRPFTIRDLIDNETISEEAAAILLLAISSRLNITITGGPGTGKTTLLNALDRMTPKWWRKIYIEDAIESRMMQGYHQVRLRVDPVDEQLSRLNKSKEIVKSLHRSPDYLILGEIQTAEHSRALFQANAAGLRSIQTCHSDTAASLISRWIHGHDIEESNLGLMDVIVTLERPKPGESLRRVKEIVEIRKGLQNGLLVFRGINTIYDSVSKKVGQFTEDGAFRTLATSLGIINHEKALTSLIAAFHNQDEDLEKLCESLWKFGHPMKYVL